MYTKVDADRDNDVEAAPYDDTGNERSYTTYGAQVDPADARTVAALVKRYYATAVAEDGARACTMIDSQLVKAIPEDYGTPSGPTYLRGGKTCAAVLVKLFKYVHSQLAPVAGSLKVTAVRIHNGVGIAVMRIGKAEREIIIEREGTTWKIGSLLDREVP